MAWKVLACKAAPGTCTGQSCRLASGFLFTVAYDLGVSLSAVKRSQRYAMCGAA